MMKLENLLVYTILLQLYATVLEAHAPMRMPAELAMRIKKVNIDGTCIKPIPITEEVMREVTSGAQPGDYCGDLPCQIPYADWWCAMCGAVWPYCVVSPMQNSTFCNWCEIEGCMVTEIPPSSSEDYPDYFSLDDYADGPFPDPK